MEVKFFERAAMKKRIMCVGMCVLDIIQSIDDYPDEDTKKPAMDGYWQRGGNASNNCTVLRQLGANCEFLGYLSEATGFHFLADDLRKRGVIIDHCPTTIHEPPLSSVLLVRPHGTRTIIHTINNTKQVSFDHFRTISLCPYGWVHFEGRNFNETQRMIRHIHAHNMKSVTPSKIKISVELEASNQDSLVLAEYADYVFISKDMAKYMGWRDSHDAVYNMRKKLHCHANVGKRKPGLICPWGSQGASSLDSNDKYAHSSAVGSIAVIDTLGAGDTFCAATIYGIHDMYLDLQDAVAFANKCAGFKVAHRGYDNISEFIFEYRA